MASIDPSILQDLQDEGTPFPFTCPKCVDPNGLPARGYMDSELYYDERYHKRHGLWTDGDFYNKGDINIDVEFLPHRCPSCNRHYCKYKNTKKQSYKLNELSQQRRGERPKLITVGLISEWNDPRDKFHQHKELMQRWELLRQFLVKHHFITGGFYVREMTTKVSFDGKVFYWDDESESYTEHIIGDPDLYGLVKYHAHIHAVVDMPTFRKGALIAFSELGYKFGLGRISVSFPKYHDTLWQTMHKFAKEISTYLTKDKDCGRQATFGSLNGFKSPSPPNGKDRTGSTQHRIQDS